MQSFLLVKVCVIVFALTFARFAATQNVNDDCAMAGTGAAGTCVLLQNCASALEDIAKNSLYPTNCGYQNGEQIVCCRKSPTAKPSPAPATRISEKKCVEYQAPVYERISVSIGLSMNTFQKKIFRCPIAYVPLIVGGEAAKAKEFPHMALIGYDAGSTGETRWLCGGSLISEQFVLTAAHCVFTRQAGYAQLVRLGDTVISTNEDDAQPIDVKIIERIRHPDNKIPAKYNDIALLKLEHPVVLSQYVRPACLAETFDIPTQKVIATGWGRTEYAEKISDALQKAVLDVVPHLICNASYAPHLSRNLREGVVDRTQFCLGSELHRDTCQGDSGGPVQVYHSSVQCMYAIVGITSFGIRCAETGLPGVYTRVYPYIDWIEGIVWPE